MVSQDEHSASHKSLIAMTVSELLDRQNIDVTFTDFTETFDNCGHVVMQTKCLERNGWATSSYEINSSLLQ